MYDTLFYYYCKIIIYLQYGMIFINVSPLNDNTVSAESGGLQVSRFTAMAWFII